MRPQTVTVVDCAERHNAEVARAWAAGDPPADGPAFEVLVGSSFLQRGSRMSSPSCWAAQHAHLNDRRSDPSQTWRIVEPLVISQLITAPAEQRTAHRGWVVCVVGSLDRGDYTGSLRGGFTAAHPWDGRLASCLPTRAAGGSAGWTTCSGSHRVEVLGVFDRGSVVNEHGEFVGMPSSDVLVASCATLATSLIGTDDPTFGGRLTVGALQLLPDWIARITTYRSDGSASDTYIPIPLCFIEPAGAGELRGTVIGLGSGPLPIA